MDYRTAVVGVVEYQGQVLIAKKKPKPGHVLSEEWHIPGGKVESESEQDAVIREIHEEANIDVRVVRFLDEKIDERSKFRVRWYLCEPLTHELKPGDDVEEVKYVPKLEIERHCGKNAVSLWPEKVLEYLKSDL